MASKDIKKEKPIASNDGRKINLPIISENTLAKLLKKQEIKLPTYKYYGERPFNDYIEINYLFFSKIEELDECEKTAYLLSCMSDEIFRYLKLLNSNTTLIKCKYSDLVEELNNYATETKKYAEEYSKLLHIKLNYCPDMKVLHKQKLAEWINLEHLSSQKIPDMVKVLLLFKDYKEPVKSVAERYIQNHSSNINLNDFIKHMESESLFLKK